MYVSMYSYLCMYGHFLPSRLQAAILIRLTWNLQCKLRLLRGGDWSILERFSWNLQKLLAILYGWGWIYQFGCVGDEFYNYFPWNFNFISIKIYLPIKFSQKIIFFMLSKFFWLMMNLNVFEMRLVRYIINFHGILILFQSINIQKYHIANSQSRRRKQNFFSQFTAKEFFFLFYWKQGKLMKKNSL